MCAALRRIDDNLYSCDVTDYKKAIKAGFYVRQAPFSRLPELLVKTLLIDSHEACKCFFLSLNGKILRFVDARDSKVIG